MISNEDQKSFEQLIESNPAFKSALNKVSEENRLILSKFTHELRNPLTLVKSTIQLIESQHPEVSTFRFWPDLISDIDDTINLLSELSSYNHCDELSIHESDLVQVLKEAISHAKPFASTKNLQTEFCYEDATFLHTYLCDSVKLKQVFTNIIKNAIEAAFINTTIIVKLSTISASKTHSHYINISVTNMGLPIPSNLLPNIFDPFVTNKANGTGLGLYISQKIMHMHKGDISVSQTDSAITFSIQLPTDVIASKPLYVAL